MSNSKLPVTVEVADFASQIEILDGVFRVVARGFGQIRTELKPGLYKARTQVGTALQEKMFAINEGVTTAPVVLDPVLFASAAPLQGTSTSHEYHQHAVAIAVDNAEPPLILGSGSSLLLSLRDPGRAPLEQTKQSRASYARGFDGCSLCAADGSELINYDQAATRDINLGFAIRNAELDPGHYILKVEQVGLKPVALPVVTVPGWASQIFIQVEEGPSGAATHHPALAEATLMMVPLGQPFHPGDRYFRLTEVARQALQRGRNIFDRQLLDELLDSKFGNPVLGLFAAHLLLLDPQPQLKLLRIVLDNLDAMLGFDFPDLIALRRRMQQLDPPTSPAGIIQDPLVFPPLLRASWDILAAQAMMDDDLMPAGSVSRQIADRLCDNGIWLAWQPRPLEMSATQGWKMLSDDELLSKKGPDRERILSVFEQAEKYLNLDSNLGLLQVAKTLTKPVVREKLRQFIRSAAASENLPLEQLGELVLRLAKNYPWEKLLRKLNELDVDDAISERLSAVQRTILPALLLFRQQLAADQDVSADDWKQLFASLKVPRAVLLDNLGELARLAAGLEVRQAEDNMTGLNIVLANADHSKTRVLQNLRAATGLGRKEAEELVAGAPLTIRDDVSKVRAEAEVLRTLLD
ncbi:MAG TPA: ribosomal protein L7/L12 [Malonomonas sp.]